MSLPKISIPGYDAMPRQIAVFDTNVYLALGLARAVQLTHRQRASSVISFATTWTIAELGAHLADPTDPKYSRSLTAIRALWEHCSLYNGSHKYLPLAADSEDQLCQTLFNRPIPGRQLEADTIGAVVRRVATSETRSDLIKVLPVLVGLRDHCACVEAEFVDNMREVVTALDPDASGWETFRSKPQRRRALLERIDAGDGLPHLAEALVRKAAASLELAVHGSDLRGRVEFVVNHFRTPLYFYDAIIRKIVATGVDMSKPSRANSIWDLQIAFYAAPDGKVSEVPLVLVTNERAIHDAAAKAGNSGAAMPTGQRATDECSFAGDPNSYSDHAPFVIEVS